MTYFKNLFLFVSIFIATFNIFADTPEKCARPTTPEFQKSIVYQILLPLFTQEGTLKKAGEMLPHVKSTGADIVYLCPIAESDDDMNQEFWSKRQKASNTGNPKNPYRIKDYFKVEPMFGSDDDLRDFVSNAHKCGLKVVLDLVYYHCGPTAVFIKENPDFVKRNPDGSIKKGLWTFPELNFDNPKLREYLLKNMEYFVKEFDIDGYRTDVEGSVPADLWAEGYSRIRAIKKDVIMIAESRRHDAQVDAYDASYSFEWQSTVRFVFEGKKPASAIAERWKIDNSAFAKGSRLLRYMDNHDTASDSGTLRFEKRFTNSGMDAVLVLNFTIDGIPLIYMGNEIADSSHLNMFSTNSKGRCFVAWENALTDVGIGRYNLVRKLANLHRSNPAIYKGETKWLENSNPNSVLTFTRDSGENRILVVINTSAGEVRADFPSETKVGALILGRGATCDFEGGKASFKLSPYAYGVYEY